MIYQIARVRVYKKKLRQYSVPLVLLYIDQHLKWDYQTTNIITRLRKLNYFNLATRRFLNNDVPKTAHYALVQLIILYDIIFCGDLNSTLNNKL